MPEGASVRAGFPDGWFHLPALPRVCANTKWEMWGLLPHHYNSPSPGVLCLDLFCRLPSATLFLEHPPLASVPGKRDVLSANGEALWHR